MNEALNHYLEEIDNRLRPLPVSERVDIVQEIKSEIAELEAAGETPQMIMERLGSPKELSVAYLGKSLSESKTFHWKNVLAVLSFSIYAGIGGVFLLPISTVAAVSFMGCGILAPIAGVVRLVSFLFGHDIPNFQFVVGSYTANAYAFLPISIGVGLLFFAIGWICWRVTVLFIRSLMKGKCHLSN